VLGQGCQMVDLKTQNPNMGKIWRALEWKMLLYFMTIWKIFRSFGIIYRFIAVWYSLWSFGIFFQFLVRLDQKKSGNPVMGMPFRRQFWKKILL
jgi:hypothetical protein